MHDPTTQPPTPGFDRDLSLRDLLDPLDPDRLRAALEGLLQAPVRLTDPGGDVVLGEGGAPPAPGVPVAGELEPLGHLQAEGAAPKVLAAAADLLAQVLAGTRRYRMAADLHTAAVTEDYRVLQAKHAALEAAEGRVRELVATLEARVAEQVATIETAHRQLYQAEKLASVGQLAAGVAHEINNPIGFIRSNLRSAQGYLGSLQTFSGALNAGDDPAAAWRSAGLDAVVEDLGAILTECSEGADRIARIVGDLKGFARLDGQGEETVDVNDLVRGACNVGGVPLRGRVAVDFDLAAGLPPVICDPARMGLVFLNLLANAAEATGDGGRISFVTAAEGGQVRVTVTDNGRGIPPEALPRIFEPFFTTRGVGEGTGLGLTVCRDTVRVYGGRIEVESQVGRGTTVRVHLPAAG